MSHDEDSVAFWADGGRIMRETIPLLRSAGYGTPEIVTLLRGLADRPESWCAETRASKLEASTTE